MRRFRIGKATKEDIKMINSRFYTNSDVNLPPFPKIRCACFMNDERNAYNNVVFLEHLKATHPKANYSNTPSPMHTCIIKANIKYGSKSIGSMNKGMYNHLLDQCGDSDILNGSKSFVDPALNFFHKIPLMMNTDARIEEELANGTPYRGLYIKLKVKSGSEFVQGSWEGYMVNTIFANQVENIVCMQEGSTEKYFLVKPDTRQCKIKLRRYNNTIFGKLKLSTYL